MKNITVSLDDETYQKVRTKAAELDTSVSALVRHYLSAIVSQESEFQRLETQENEIRKNMVAFRGSDRLARDALYDRKSRTRDKT